MKLQYKIIFIQIILLFFLLPGCFKREEILFEDKNINLLPGTETELYESESIELRSGVYQVRIEAENVEGGTLFANVYSEQSNFRSLRCNGSPMYERQTYIDFEVYTLGKIDNAYVEIRSSCVENVTLKTVEVYRLNWGARILLFWYIVGCMLLDGMLIFRSGILEGRIKKEQQVVFWGLLFSVLLAYYPYFTDYISGAHDIFFHLLRIEGLKETLLQGSQFPVRVQSYWLYDHGYAVSSFYGDIFLLIPVFFRLVGFPLMTAYKMFVFMIMTVTALITYLSIKRCVKHKYAALFGTLVYVLAPYRLYNFYNRGALGEALAMIFLPLVICGMYELYTKDVEDSDYTSAKLPLIVGLSCILQSHLLTCEMVVIFLLFTCLVFLKKTLRKKTLIQLLQTGGWCLLINCWFWVPLLQMMMTDRNLLTTIINREVQSKGTQFAQVLQLYPNQGDTQSGMYMAAPFHIGVVSLVVLVAVLLGVLRKRLIQKSDRHTNLYDKTVLLLAGMILGMCIMSTQYFPWDMLAELPIVGFLVSALQFPTRLFSPISALCAFMTGFFCLWFKEECKNFIFEKVWREYVQTGCILLLSILCIGSAVYQVNDIAYSRAPLWLYTAENMGMTKALYYKGFASYRIAEGVSWLSIITLILWAGGKTWKKRIK